MHLGRRGLCVLLLVLSGLIPLQPLSLAQGAGSELAEAISADAAGSEAYLSLQSIEPFPASGGEAVLEPGTPYEETVTYEMADASSNRLVGLTRPAPLAHAVGVFVAAPTHKTAEPEPSPTRDEPATAPTEVTSGKDGSSNRFSDIAGAPPEVCEPVSLGGTCGEVLDDTVEQIADPRSPDDLCDADNSGRTCVEYLEEILGPLVNDGICDPDNSGQTCVEYIGKILALLIDDDPPSINITHCTASVDQPPTEVCCWVNGSWMVIWAAGSFSCNREQVWMNIHLVLEPPGGEPPVSLPGLDTNENEYNSDEVSTSMEVPCVAGLWRLGVYGTTSSGASDVAYSDYLLIEPWMCIPR